MRFTLAPAVGCRKPGVLQEGPRGTCACTGDRPVQVKPDQWLIIQGRIDGNILLPSAV
ncbi:hypothetical protein GCM10011348_46640 [Marinobacterium nitratireducens]|uniref:Uncharacterized protein n=1 Tax=Marinobacterium nitratireducens TaxID=518897 RepID=A0A917ZR32_9GAMM|nr:hypothetical protein GCM10011348_46640 [Marinobacterium nitratireducens]